MHCILGVQIASNTMSPTTVEVSASTRAVPNHGRGFPPGSLCDSPPAERGTDNTLKGSDVTFPGRDTPNLDSSLRRSRANSLNLLADLSCGGGGSSGYLGPWFQKELRELVEARLQEEEQSLAHALYFRRPNSF
jgi:hypothetical protein